MPTTKVLICGMPAKPAIAAAAASATWLRVHPVGTPSVTSRTAAVRMPICCIVYWRAYWIAPVSAGVVGVPPFGMLAAIAILIGAALPGSGAIATVGVA